MNSQKLIDSLLNYKLVFDFTRQIKFPKSKQNFQSLRYEELQNTGCSKSLGHILTLNISETIKDIKTHLVNSESL